MYPYSHPDFARHRIAERHRKAQRDALAHAVRRARRARTGRPGHAMPVRLARAARRMLAPGRTRAGRRPASSAG